MPTISEDVASLSEILWSAFIERASEEDRENLSVKTALLHLEDPEAKASLRVLETFIMALKEGLEEIPVFDISQLNLSVPIDLMPTIFFIRTTAIEQYQLEAKLESDSPSKFANSFLHGHVWNALGYAYEFEEMLETIYEKDEAEEIIEEIWNPEITPVEERYDRVYDYLVEVRAKQSEQ